MGAPVNEGGRTGMRDVIGRLTRSLRSALMPAALAVLAGCSGLPSVGPDYRGPPPDRSIALAQSPAPVKLEADRWQAPLPHAGSNDDLARWWQQFNDPALDAFIAAAERENPTLARAAANIERARAITVAAQANAPAGG